MELYYVPSSKSHSLLDHHQHTTVVRIMRLATISSIQAALPSTRIVPLILDQFLYIGLGVKNRVWQISTFIMKVIISQHWPQHVLVQHVTPLHTAVMRDVYKNGV